MGILNVTPDSFSDGGRHARPGGRHRRRAGDGRPGADILDVGGESTRPGRRRGSPEEEQARILPVIRALAERGLHASRSTPGMRRRWRRRSMPAPRSSTMSPPLRTIRQRHRSWRARGCPVVLMHMRGTPATMNSFARYEDVATEVVAELVAPASQAAERGRHRRERIVLDPGIGFAKTAGAEYRDCCTRLARSARLGCPILVGVSRKCVHRQAGRCSESRRSAAPAPSRPGCGPWRTARRSCGFTMSRRRSRRCGSGTRSNGWYDLATACAVPVAIDRFRDQDRMDMHRHGQQDAFSAPTASAARPTRTR